MEWAFLAREEAPTPAQMEPIARRIAARSERPPHLIAFAHGISQVVSDAHALAVKGRDPSAFLMGNAEMVREKLSMKWFGWDAAALPWLSVSRLWLRYAYNAHVAVQISHEVPVYSSPD